MDLQAVEMKPVRRPDRRREAVAEPPRYHRRPTSVAAGSPHNAAQLPSSASEAGAANQASGALIASRSGSAANPIPGT
jgi:hypothetical protein